MRPGPLPWVVRSFWLHVSAGLSPELAGVAVGVSQQSGRKWFADAGGVKPKPAVEGPRRRPRLSLDEREEIACGVAAQESLNSIAKRLGRHPSTISREIKLNSSHGRNRYRSQYRFGASWRGGPQRRPHYRASTAQAKSQCRARRPKLGKLATHHRLREQVQTRLDQLHSPAQIAARLRQDFADEPEMWVSHETIYQSLYVQGRGQLRRDLHQCLRSGRAVRKPQRRTGERRGRIRDMVSAHPRWPTARSLATGRAI